MPQHSTCTLPSVLTQCGEAIPRPAVLSGRLSAGEPEMETNGISGIIGIRDLVPQASGLAIPALLLSPDGNRTMVLVALVLIQLKNLLKTLAQLAETAVEAALVVATNLNLAQQVEIAAEAVHAAVVATKSPKLVQPAAVAAETVLAVAQPLRLLQSPPRLSPRQQTVPLAAIAAAVVLAVVAVRRSLLQDPPAVRLVETAVKAVLVAALAQKPVRPLRLFWSLPRTALHLILLTAQPGGTVVAVVLVGAKVQKKAVVAVMMKEVIKRMKPVVQLVVIAVNTVHVVAASLRLVQQEETVAGAALVAAASLKLAQLVEIVAEAVLVAVLQPRTNLLALQKQLQLQNLLAAEKSHPPARINKPFLQKVS